MTSLEDQQALLLYRVGPVLCCSPSYTVLSIIQPVPLTHPPGADTARPGIFRHSGHVIKTEELRVRFGVEAADRKPGRMIIAEVDSGRTAFWVDDIIDVISMPAQGWGQLPPHLPKGIFSRTLLLDDKIYLYADFDGLHKLQGHGLLKTYIEQLLEEKRQQEEPKPQRQTTQSVTAAKQHKAAASVTETNTTARTTVGIPEKPKTITASTTTAIEKRVSAAKRTVTASKESKAKPQAETAKAIPGHQPATIAKPTLDKDTGADQTPLPPAAQAASHQRTATAGRSTVEHNKSTTTEASKTPPPETSAINRAKQPRPLTKAKPETVSLEPAESQAAKPVHQQPTSNGGFPWLIFVMLVFLLSAGGAGSYYFWQVKTTPQLAHSSRQMPAASKTSNPPAPVTITSIPVPREESIEPVIAEPVTETLPATTTVVEVKPQPEPASDYEAKIEQDDEGITIVIKAPKEEMALRLDTAENKTNEPITPPPEQVASESIPVSPEATAKQATPKVPQREEITHIVVKGDTLWHIAKRYVNNPFRYPELARLSNIKNPDLIYPGNRVRIIREFN